MVEKGVLAAIGIVAGVGFAGYVGYKIIKKKKPLLFYNIKKTVTDLPEKGLNVVKDAKKSFQEGYRTAHKRSSVSSYSV